MNQARLQSLLTCGVGFDTETHLIQPGLLAPPLVCGSFARYLDGKIVGDVVDANTTRLVFHQLLDNDDVVFVVANGVFDLLVLATEFARLKINLLPKIFRLYEHERVFDIQIAEALHGVALGLLGKDLRSGRKLTNRKTGKSGHYSLDNVHELVTGKTGAKANDKYRSSYALLENTPINQWPTEAKIYPVEDACNTLEDALAQVGLIPNVGVHDFEEFGSDLRCKKCSTVLRENTPAECRSLTPRENLHDLSTQCYTHWCMHLGAAWGFTVDQKAVDELEYKVTKDLESDIQPFRSVGIVREDGTESQNVLKTLVAKAYGAVETCPDCAGIELRGKTNPGKVISPITLKTWVNCDSCDGTALKLTQQTPRTEKDAVGKGRDVLAESGDELLMSYAAFGEDKKIRETYIPWLREGVNAPITLSPNVLLETNRTSYRDKTQTLPRDGGVRECIVPRPGTAFYSCDYGGIELCTWAQICLWICGYSSLAKALNADVNVHGALGATMSGQRYAEFMALVKAGDKRANDFRQAAKPANFGFPGGMGPIRLVHQQRAQGPDTPHPTGPIVARRGQYKGQRIYRGMRFCLLIGGADRCGVKMYSSEDCPPTCQVCIDCAITIKEGWKKQWPEERDYFKAINKISDQGFQIHPISKRKRGGVGFCDAANGEFQELAAQGAKDGLRHIVREQYDCEYRPEDLDGEVSILLNNSRNIAFLHDENLGEARIEVAPEVAERVSKVMIDRMKIYVPDVKVTVEPTLMPRWYKAAKCVRDSNGRLQVWQPKE